MFTMKLGKMFLKSIPELGFFFIPVFIVLKFLFKINKINPGHSLLFPKFKSTKKNLQLLKQIEPWTYDSCSKA